MEQDDEATRRRPEPGPRGHPGGGCVHHPVGSHRAVSMGAVKVVRLTILGEPASKANSRKLVKFGDRPASIKSDKARNYAAAIAQQVRRLPELLEGDLSLTATIYYASRRPDLDESIIMDGLQGLIYKNDRQIKAKHIYWALDRENPRAEVIIAPIATEVDRLRGKI